MQIKSFMLLGLAVFCLHAQAATVLDFDNQTDFDNQFPSATRYKSGALSSYTLLTGPSRLAIHAQADTATTARAMIYSTSSSDYDFLSAAKSYSFRDVQMSYTTSGTTYTSYVGLFSGNGNALTVSGGPNDGVYFHMDRYTSLLTLELRQDAAVSVLYTFNNTGSGYSYDDLTFTLTGTTWSASVTFGGTTQTASGTFATALTTSNWGTGTGTNFYLGLGAFQSSSSASRYTELELSQIVVGAVPEPPSTALLLSGLMAGAVWVWRRSGRTPAVRV